MEIWQQILIIFAAMLGIPVGIIIANICKEELKAGRKWFVLISFFSIVSIFTFVILSLISGEIRIIPALLIILILFCGLFSRKVSFFYILMFIINIINAFSGSDFIYIPLFSFISFISLTAYALSYKKERKLKNKRIKKK
jgi:uncharacterized membrane protein